MKCEFEPHSFDVIIDNANGTYHCGPSFMYGGESRYGKIESTSDIYVLSIPAFQWFRVDVQSTKRASHDCALAGNSQMIVVGGMDLTIDEANDNRWKTTDKLTRGLGVFDLNELKWSDKYDPEAAKYKIPTMVKGWYEDGYGCHAHSQMGTSTNFRNRGFDNIDWDSEETKNLFKSFKLLSEENSEEVKRKTKPVGAIVGGSIGGVAGVAATGALVFWLLRHRRKKEKPVDGPEVVEDPRVGSPKLYAGPEHHEALLRQELDASGHGQSHFRQELEGSSARPSVTIKRKAVGSSNPSESKA